MEAAFVTGLC